VTIATLALASTYGIADWTRESVATYVEQRLEDILVDVAR
jgi:hypothetical protein